MTTYALIALGFAVLRYGIRELGAGLRQRSALRSLERLAEQHPDSATLVPAVVQAATSTQARRASHSPADRDSNVSHESNGPGSGVRWLERGPH